MLSWLFLAMERRAAANSKRLARAIGIVPHWVVRRIAEAKLVRTLRHVWRHNEHQRRRWHDAGVRWHHLRGAKALERIPLLDPDEVAVNPELYYCVPKTEFTQVMSTSGTGGRARKIFFTASDIDNQAKLLGAAMRRLPGGASTVLVLIGSVDAVYGPGEMARRAAEMAGMLSFQSTRSDNAAKQIEYIREHKPDVIIGIPTGMHQLTLQSEGVDLRALGVRYIVLSSQPMPKGLRELLESAWGAVVIDLYATNEHGAGIAAECPKGTGLHVAETDFWIEILDPVTKKPVPEGTEGEIVITTLSRRGMPLVRYCIGDLTRLLPYEGRCSCGAPLSKIAPIRGRVDHMLILGSGYNVYPDEFDHALLSVPGVTDYQITVDKKDFQDILSVAVESAAPGDGLETRVLDAIRTIKYLHGVNSDKGSVLLGGITVVAPGTLSKGRRKSVRIVDKRQY